MIFSEETHCTTANRKIVGIYGFQMLNLTFKPWSQEISSWLLPNDWLFCGFLHTFSITSSWLLSYKPLQILLSSSFLFVNYISQWTTKPQVCLLLQYVVHTQESKLNHVQYLIFSFHQFRLGAYTLNPVVGVISPVIYVDQDWVRVGNASAGQKKKCSKSDHLLMLAAV